VRSGPSTARRRRPLRARLFDAGAVVVVGGVIVGAALVPALTASTEPATAVDGDVHAAGAAVAGMAIGFWSPTEGVLATTTSDSTGRFVLPVPTGSDGYVYAGTRPDAVRAISSVGGRQLVRGIIGAVPRPGIASPLYQGFAAATARNIAGGRSVHFSLQAPGRLTGTSRLLTTPGVRLELQRLDGSVVQVVKADRKGRFATQPVVPGDYRLQVVPKAPLVPATLPVHVSVGRTTPVTLPTPQRGATLSGSLTADGTSVGPGIPVLLLRDGDQVAATTTDADGAYRFPGLAAGTYSLVLGRAAAPSGSAIPTSGPAADEVLPATVTVQVAGTLQDVVQDQSLAPAGIVTGTVTGTDGTPATVLAEDRTSHAVVRSSNVAVDGTFRLGGLAPGTQYDLVAVTNPSDPAATVWGTTTATAKAGDAGSGSAADAPSIVVATPGFSLSGRVPGATGGTVTVGDPAGFARTGTVGEGGSYAVQGLVPGAFPATVQEPGRVSSDPTTVALTGAANQDLPRAPEAATYKAWFISGGAGVPRITGTAVDTTGHLVRFGPATDKGHVTIPGLAPGTYRYREPTFAGSIAAVDGPWWFGPPTGTFALRAGATTDVGPVVLHIHAH
jgi:hypothetical protein